MQASNLKPAGQLVQRYGVKALIYGQPGSGKTPMLNTLPRPVLLATEPGLLSMRDSLIPTWEAYTPEKIEEFFAWFFQSAEVKNFDSLAIDSGSQLAEIRLTRELKRNKDGRKAYGELSRSCMEDFSKLFFMPQKHIFMNCKMQRAEVGKNVVVEGGQFSVEMSYQNQPYFPGQDLNIKVPHLYDEILFVGEATIPGLGKKVAIRTKGTDEIMARDRSGRLAELEPPDLGLLIQKAMQ